MQSYKGVHVRVRTGAFCSEAILRIQVVTIQCILAPVRTVRGGEGGGSLRSCLPQGRIVGRTVGDFNLSILSR